MEFNQKENIYLSLDKVRELIKDLKPGTMLTLETGAKPLAAPQNKEQQNR